MHTWKKSFMICSPTHPEASVSVFRQQKGRVQEIGRELYADGGADALENIFFSIEHRVKEEIDRDAKPYRMWWNGIANEWKY